MEPIEGEGKQHLTFSAPSRGLIGFRSQFATLTRGSGLMHRAFAEYREYAGPLDRVRKGALVAMAGQIQYSSIRHETPAPHSLCFRWTAFAMAPCQGWWKCVQLASSGSALGSEES